VPKPGMHGPLAGFGPQTCYFQSSQQVKCTWNFSWM